MPHVKPSRLAIVQRTFEILRLIQLRPMTGKEIADEIECSVYTVYRHLWALRKAGLKIHSQRNEHGFDGYVIAECPICSGNPARPAKR